MLKITPYAKNQYFKSQKKKAGHKLNIQWRIFFCLNMSLRKFDLWNFFTSFLAICMANLLCICANVLPKYPNY